MTEMASYWQKVKTDPDPYCEACGEQTKLPIALWDDQGGVTYVTTLAIAILCPNCFGSLDNRYWNGLLPRDGDVIESPAWSRLRTRWIKDFYKERETVRRKYDRT